MAARVVETAQALTAIAERFAIAGAPQRIDGHARGHINATWFVTTDAGARYVLQRINPHVFIDPAGVVRNTARVIAEVQRTEPALVPPFVAARDGAASVSDDGATYRMLGYVLGRALDGLESVAQAAASGLAFGRFQRALERYDRSPHVMPIAHFHELTFQLERFDRALERPAPGRLASAADEIAEAQRERTRLVAEALGPSGMIHGDGKVSNLLFDAADDVCAVLDLDTVMWGHLSWDFGDLVRSAAALGGEDDPAIGFSVERYRALAAGYVRGAAHLVTPELRAALGVVPAYMAYMLALRFLIDHLDGDVYFRVDRPGHNLVRARSQLRLFRAMTAARAELERIATEA